MSMDRVYVSLSMNLNATDFSICISLLSFSSSALVSCTQFGLAMHPIQCAIWKENVLLQTQTIFAIFIFHTFLSFGEEKNWMEIGPKSTRISKILIIRKRKTQTSNFPNRNAVNYFISVCWKKVFNYSVWLFVFSFHFASSSSI